jgi:uncharacterized protein YfdQ (DUF2303 family)
MFDKEAVIKLQEGASISQAQGAMMLSSSTKDTVALPSDFKVHDLEKYLPTRRRARGNMQTESLQDFASYFKDHQEHGATVFVDQDKMRAVGVLNLGVSDAPGHADNTATLSMVPTPAYDAFREVCNGGPVSQARVAEWIEDWQDMIRCFHIAETEEGVVPALNTQKAIAAVRNITIDSARKVESEEGQLSASKGSFESVKASSKHTLPTHIQLRTEAYAGLNDRLFIIRLGILTGGDKVSISLRPVKMEEHRQEMANEFAELTRIELQGVPVLIGRYEVK